MTFQGFSPEAVDFLWQIRFNNDRTWFQINKQRYIELIRDPLHQLAVEVQDELSRRCPKVQLNVRVSRIYRDARRLHGHGPYKDHMWFILHRPAQDAHGGAAPAFYFELAPEYYSIGMGCYSATPKTMARLRARMDRDPAPMEGLARRMNRQKNFVLEGEGYRRPKGDKGALLNPWYNRKTIALEWNRSCGGSLFTGELVQEIAGGVEFLMPFFDYLSTLDDDPEPEKM